FDEVEILLEARTTGRLQAAREAVVGHGALRRPERDAGKLADQPAHALESGGTELGAVVNDSHRRPVRGREHVNAQPGRRGRASGSGSPWPATRNARLRDVPSFPARAESFRARARRARPAYALRGGA